MQRRQRLIYLALSLLILLIIGRATTGSFSFITGDFWFTSGLLLLILLSTVDQPFFSKDSHVFMNAITGGVSLLLVPPSGRPAIWWAFLTWTLYLAISSFAIMAYRTRKLSDEPPFLALVSRLNRQLGKPEALFSAFFIWGVVSDLGTGSTAYFALMIFWAVFIILDMPAVSQYISTALAAKPQPGTAPRGILRGFSSPRLLECELDPHTPPLPPGTHASLRLPSGAEAAECQVIDDRAVAGSRYARVAVTRPTEHWMALADSRTPGTEIALEVHVEEPVDKAVVPAGVVSPGSTIGNLHIMVNPDTDLVEGEVLAVDLPQRRAYYQVVGATLRETALEQSQSLQDVEVVASQLGIWRDDRCRFEPVSWVAPAGGLVNRIRNMDALQIQVPEGHLRVGKVPNSAFPVHLALEDVVTHNTAILGVTGSGKSYLAFWLIEGLAAAGVRVLILDVSRQHWVFLRRHNPVQITSPDDVRAWMDTDSKIAIHQFANSQNYPLTTSQMVAAAFEKLESSIKLKAGTNEPARLCVVFEEAHSLIPEWNQVAQEADKQHVNRTARTVLQGRKYGMGCIVISQRTANVTKTILNQCNTIVALQSFDQTGLDFLSNYMGTAYANAISTLPTQHAVLVGKASSSTRPILFQICELGDAWKDPTPLAQVVPVDQAAGK